MRWQCDTMQRRHRHTRSITEERPRRCMQRRGPAPRRDVAEEHRRTQRDPNQVACAVLFPPTLALVCALQLLHCIVLALTLTRAGTCALHHTGVAAPSRREGSVNRGVIHSVSVRGLPPHDGREILANLDAKATGATRARAVLVEAVLVAAGVLRRVSHLREHAAGVGDLQQ